MKNRSSTIFRLSSLLDKEKLHNTFVQGTILTKLRWKEKLVTKRINDKDTRKGD